MTDLPAMLVPALGAVLFDFLWQGAVIGLLAWLALALLRNARPQARYAVACAALLACVLIPGWHLLQATGARSEAATVPVDTLQAMPDAPWSSPRSSALAFDALPALPDAALPWIVALWALGAGVLGLRMACGLLWVRRLRHGSTPWDRDGWQTRLDQLARRFGIRRAVALRIISDGDSPLSAGWWKPVVLVPAAIALHMPVHLLESLLAHELAHIRRHDYLVNLLQGAVEVLLFYHPVVWWLSRRIRIEREQVADHIAASVLGEPRRLAIALSALDRYAPAHPTFAQAAHGGQLMSRIQLLVRPDRKAVGSIVALPLIGLAAVGIAFYAQARYEPAAAATVKVAAAAATQAAHDAAQAQAAHAVAQASHAVAQAAHAAAQAASATAPSPLTLTTDIKIVTRPIIRIVSRAEHPQSGYALVRKDREGFSMSGDLDDVEAIRAARRSIDDDFIWFKRDDKQYVVRDAALLARAEAAWQPTRALETKMQALDARMKPHSEKLEALGARMESLAGNAGESPAMRAAAEQMEVLGNQQGALGERQAELGQQMMRADDATREQLQRQMEVLEQQQHELAQQMEQQSKVLEAESKHLELRHGPMEALGREMEVASQPMEAIGKDMEVLGKQIEQAAAVADTEIRKVIDEALARGLATPAPARE